jgi:hypothetical protein
MSSIAIPTTDPHRSVVHYRFTHLGAGVELDLWEPLSADPASPYRFRLKAEYSSEWEAVTALQQYLQWNDPVQAIAVSPSPLKTPDAVLHVTWVGRRASR